MTMWMCCLSGWVTTSGFYWRVRWLQYIGYDTWDVVHPTRFVFVGCQHGMTGHIVGGVDTSPGSSLLVFEFFILSEEELLLSLEFFQLVLKISLEVHQVIFIEVPFGTFLRLITWMSTFSNSNMSELRLFSISLYFNSKSVILDFKLSLSTSNYLEYSIIFWSRSYLSYSTSCWRRFSLSKSSANFFSESSWFPILPC